MTRTLLLVLALTLAAFACSGPDLSDPGPNIYTYTAPASSETPLTPPISAPTPEGCPTQAELLYFAALTPLMEDILSVIEQLDSDLAQMESNPLVFFDGEWKDSVALNSGVAWTAASRLNSVLSDPAVAVDAALTVSRHAEDAAWSFVYVGGGVEFMLANRDAGDALREALMVIGDLREGRESLAAAMDAMDAFCDR